MDVYENIRQHQLEMVHQVQTAGEYLKVKQTGNYLYVAGHGPTRNGRPVHTGRVGGALDLEQGRDAARVCALNILGSLHDYLGDLNRVKNIVKLLAFVASDDGFDQQPAVINAASEVFIQVFGERGRHSRPAIGVNVLPGNIPVEIEAVTEIDP